MAVGAEVAGAALLGAAPDHHPRELVADRDRQPRVGLVVAVLDVEARVELLDPGVLQLERLDLGLDDRPLDAGARTMTIVAVRWCRLPMSWKYDDSRARRFFALPT